VRRSATGNVHTFLYSKDWYETVHLSLLTGS
jgi:hypothetical protein